ncbi:Ribosomal RNA small subunit methyltransferase A [Candidatus Cardinium hertigii]|uniref:Ribosomal RNA small subunit methyltransferase A n=2 Tax=Candidatus Cardinium hertigii TaxID=247481 RepID=A0A2Z3LE04_9BACT|nr:Ribosomal RNA small subunit methyltransferase A [Candidatus Cardinium hertigii]
MISAVRAKKSLGQHFLKDPAVAQRIVNLLTAERCQHTVLEVGPGTGSLTDFLLQKAIAKLYLIEIDQDLIFHLKEKYVSLNNEIIAADFLAYSLSEQFKDTRLTIIGNFPYYISSQIFFKILHNRQIVEEVVGMVQKEVAERLVAQAGNKRYGILSVLLQAFYTLEYCFTVPREAFFPSPRVDSAVITMHRNKVSELACNEQSFFQIVKSAFQQRRKKLRNALHAYHPNRLHAAQMFLDKRAEALSVAEFIQLTNILDSQ